MKAAIRAIEYFLPERELSNTELATVFPDWTAEKILQKTGISNRHIAAEAECVSDLGTSAALKLFDTGICNPRDIDYLLLCTQSPDFFLPTTACIVQDRLGLRTECGATDFNLGCSGYVYGLGVAKGLIETGQAENVLLITAETYSKHIHPDDKSVRTIFGDAASATLIQGSLSEQDEIGPFVYGTDGRGANNLIVPTGGFRAPRVANPPIVQDDSGNQRTVNNLYMNGAEIFSFTLKAVPAAVESLLAKSGLTADSIDIFAFHQANRYMLDHIRRKLRIPEAKFPIMMEHCGNTVSSTIPILLKDLEHAGKIVQGQSLMLLGFGVGYSWAGCILRWKHA